jgi:protein O-GlcNAc transferase
MAGQPFIIIPTFTNEPADEWVTLGTEVHQAGKHDKAQRYYTTALRIDPGHAIASANMAIVLAQTKQLADAMLHIDRATLFDPMQPLIWANRTLIYLEAGFVEEALASADKAIELTPDKPTPHSTGIEENGYQAARMVRGVMCGHMGHPGDSIPYYRQMLEVDPKNVMAGQNACFAQSLIDCSPADMLAQRRVWHAANSYGRTWSHGNDKDTERPLRVGYVSGDFKLHSAAMIFANVIFNHTEAVEPFLYSTAPTEPESDWFTRLFRTAGQWRELQGVSDADADDMIRADKIDILVDLSGVTNGGRLKLFTLRPAPIQVTAWGFVLGSGLPEMDYFFADPVCIPHEDRIHYTEKIVDLPSVVTYRPPVEYNIAVNETSPLAKNGYVTFSSFGRFEKISDEYLAAVAEIMRRVPNSRLWLKDHAYRRPHSIQRIWNAMPGIDRRRIVFGVSTSHPDHLIACQQADIFLDPYPHCGGVTSLEMLWSAVPIVTRSGCQPAGRLGASMLTAIGRAEWITHSQKEYIEVAVALANNPAELAGIRKTLRQDLLDSPIVKGYPQSVESAYRQCWKEYCQRG